MARRNKTHDGAKKRLRVTASGKVKRFKAGKSHLNSHKTGKRLRQLRRSQIVEIALAPKYVIAILGKK